jgi:hypothetical protein
VLFEIALNYADNARLIGAYPMKLDARLQGERRRKLDRHAYQILREAIADGFRDIARRWREPSFLSYHADAEFQAVAATLDAPAFPADPFAKP